MKPTAPRFINPFTDFGFKKLFGQEANKDLLIDFLNELLPPEEGRIKELTYMKTTQLGRISGDRLAIYDVHCKNERDETFIVELQQGYQASFKDRALYYSTFPIRDQAKKGEWDYNLKKVYAVALLNFEFRENSDKKRPKQNIVDEVMSVVKLMNVKTKDIFYDKLTFIYLEAPRFNKTEKELKTKFDKWLYILCNLDKLPSIPKRMQEKIFMKLFDEAEIANFTREEADRYELSLKSLRDKNNIEAHIKETAYKEGLNKGLVEGKLEGKLEGKIEGKMEIAKLALEKKYPITMIAEITGLSESEIQKINDETL